MNILHLSMAKSWRGGEQQIVYLFNELKNKSLSQIIACARNSPLEKYCIDNNIKYYSLGNSFLYSVSNAAKIKKICKRDKIDIIHIHDSKAHTLAYISTILNNSVPLIVSRRVDFPVRNSFFSKAKYNHSSVKKIICVSMAIEKIMSNGINDKTKLQTIYSGIDIEKFSGIKKPSFELREQYKLDKNNILIGNIAAIAPHKDFHTFVDTAVIIVKKYPQCRFFIIGEGVLTGTIKSYIKSKGLENKVFMTGFQKNIKKLLLDLDIFLITSNTEGLGTSILDAFAAGIPVVATEAGGIPEIVKHKGTGLLAPVKDVEKLVENISLLIEENGLSELLSENAKQLVKQFSKTQTAQNTYYTYKEILQP